MPSQHLASLTRKSLERGKALITIIIILILIVLPGFLISSFTGRASVAQHGTGEEDRMVGRLSSFPHGVQHLPTGRAGTAVCLRSPTGSGNRRIHSLTLSDPSGTSPEKRAKAWTVISPAPCSILHFSLTVKLLDFGLAFPQR